MNNKSWKGEISYKIGVFPEIKFIGRKPIAIGNEAHKKILLSLGIFEEVGQGMLRYSGRAFYKEDDGNILEIDKNGHLPKNRADIKLSTEILAEIDKEFEEETNV